MRPLRCIFGHLLAPIAPLYNQCARCGAAFYTDYFASRALGRTVRTPISAEEARSVKRR